MQPDSSAAVHVQPYHAGRAHLSLHAAALLACVALSVLYGLSQGRDVTWDYLHYNAYSAHLLTHVERLSQDFFPAGPQSYLNPIGFAPFALSQALGWNSLTTGSWLAALHGLNAFFLYLLCYALAKGAGRREQVALGLGWMLGATAPILLNQIGSTFVDPIGAVPVMAAAWLVVAHQRPAITALAGGLAGLAVAIKLSNVVFALPIALVIALPRRGDTPSGWMKRCASGAAGMLGGYVMFQGWWSWKVWQLTGNPLFPFFNGLFQSPWLPVEGGGAMRFQPATALEWLTFPWRLAKPGTWVYVEMNAPTVAPLLAGIAAVLLALKLVFRRWRGQAPAATGGSHAWPLWVMVAASWCLWLGTSGNGRYAIPLFLLLGPALATLLLRLLPVRYALLVLALLVVGHLYILQSVGVSRWGARVWTPQWLSHEVPRDLREAPHLVISIASPSNSQIVPYLHPQSAFVSLRATYALPGDGATGEHLQALIRQHTGRIRIMSAILQAGDLEDIVPVMARSMGRFVDHLGLRVVEDRCQAILLERQPMLKTWFNRGLSQGVTLDLLVCDAEPATPDPVLARQRAAAAAIFDAFEAACPQLFLPGQPPIHAYDNFWRRAYLNHDAVVLMANLEADVLQIGLTGQAYVTTLGKASQWEEVLRDFDCRLPGGGLRGSAYIERYGIDGAQ